MRWSIVLVFLSGLSACGDNARQATVVPLSIDISLPLWSHYGSLAVLFLSLYPLDNGVSIKRSPSLRGK